MVSVNYKLQVFPQRKKLNDMKFGLFLCPSQGGRVTRPMERVLTTCRTERVLITSQKSYIAAILGSK